MTPDPQVQAVQQTPIRNLINTATTCLLALLLITALGLSAWAFVIDQNEGESRKESKDFEDSLKDEIKAFDNKSEARIVLLASEIKAFKLSYLNDVNDVKSSVGSKIVKLNQDLLNMQAELSSVQSDVEGLRGNLTKIKDTIADEHSKVWTEFTKLTNEFNNLKRSVDKKMSKFSEDLEEVAGFKSDVQELKGNVENVENSMEHEKTKVWVEFAKLEKELKNR